MSNRARLNQNPAPTTSSCPLPTRGSPLRSHLGAPQAYPLQMTPNKTPEYGFSKLLLMYEDLYIQKERLEPSSPQPSPESSPEPTPQHSQGISTQSSNGPSLESREINEIDDINWSAVRNRELSSTSERRANKQLQWIKLRMLSIRKSLVRCMALMVTGETLPAEVEDMIFELVKEPKRIDLPQPRYLPAIPPRP